MHLFRTRLVFLLSGLLLLGPVVSAQVPRNNIASIYVTSVTMTNDCGQSGEVWLMMDGTCAAPGTTPWISTLRMVSGTQTVNIARANVTRLTTATDCGATPAPCLRAQNVTLPSGNWQARFITNAGVEGGLSSPAVPFNPQPAPPAAPGSLRLAQP